MGWLTEQRRAWTYRLLLAAVAVAAVYGVIGEDEVTAWTALIAALLGNGLATLNTSTEVES